MNGKSIYVPGYRHWALCIESASGEMEGVDFSPLRKSPGPAAGGGGRGWGEWMEGRKQLCLNWVGVWVRPIWGAQWLEER